MPLQIGQILYGYCRGHLGRDAWMQQPFRVEAIGIDWVVVRGADGCPAAAFGPEALEYLQTDECTVPKSDEEF